MADKKTDRFGGVLYPDAENYDCESVLQALDTHFEEWAYILHDSDVNPDTGELKKPHYHWLGKQKSAGLVSTVANKLQIPEHDIECIKSWKGSVRYLIHIDSLEKFQYKREDITANFDMSKIFKDMNANARALRIGTAIVDGEIENTVQLWDWAMKHNCYDEVRRGYAIWFSMLREVQYERDKSRDHSAHYPA